MASPTPIAPKGSLFGTISVVCAMLTVLLPIALVLFIGCLAMLHKAEEPEYEGAATLIASGLVLAIAVAGLSSLVGTLAGIVSLVRDDPQLRRPVVGLAVNGLVLLFVALLFVVVGLSNG